MINILIVQGFISPITSAGQYEREFYYLSYCHAIFYRLSFLPLSLALFFNREHTSSFARTAQPESINVRHSGLWVDTNVSKKHAAPFFSSDYECSKIPPKRWSLPTTPHSVTTQKTNSSDIFAAARKAEVWATENGKVHES
jgi:hypothetical protein